MFIPVLCLCFSSCDLLKQDTTEATINTITLTYDYHRGLVYSGDSNNSEQIENVLGLWNLSYLSGINGIVYPDVISEFVPGDKLKLTYTGNLYGTETMPGTFYLVDGEVLSSEFIYVDVNEISSGDIIRNGVGNVTGIKNIKLNSDREYLVVNKDKTFTMLEDFQTGTLYASVENDTATCFFTYNPRIN